MARDSAIEWTDATFNPLIGCAKVSPACDHCYAEVSTPARSLGIGWGAGQPRRRTAPSNWAQPRRWNAKPFYECPACGWRGDDPAGMFCPRCPEHDDVYALRDARRRVFCASLADVFDNEVDPAWRADLFALIEATPNLDWLLLTKRIGNVKRMAPVSWLGGPVQHGPDPTNIHGGWPPNVWIGATVCNQDELERDAPKLIELRAAVRFLSIEPMLGPMNLERFLRKRTTHGRYNCAGDFVMPPSIDWVIVGGESGHGARPMHPAWPDAIREQCATEGVPFLFKQWGHWRPAMEAGDFLREDGVLVDYRNGQVEPRDGKRGPEMYPVGKKAAGRMLGRWTGGGPFATYTEYPKTITGA